MSKRQPYDGATPYYGEKKLSKVEALRAENALLQVKLTAIINDHNERILENARLREACKGALRMADADKEYVNSLRAENARLRKALKPFADCEVWEGYKDEETFVSGLKIGDLRAARAAIGESDE